jgi:hypothetical protein
MAVLLSSAAPAIAAEPHYAIDARIDPKTKQFTADVAIILPPEEIGNSTVFVLGDRFKLAKVEVGPGASYQVEPADKPIKNLQKITVTFATPPTAPRTLRFRYDGPINPPSDNNDRVYWDGAMEFNIEAGCVPFRPDLSLLYTLDAKLRGIDPKMVVVAPGHVTHKGDVVTVQRKVVDLDFPLVAAVGLQKTGNAEFELYSSDLNGKLETIYRKHAGPAMRFYNELFGKLHGNTEPVRMVVVPRKGAGYERRGFISVSDAKEELANTPVIPEEGPTRLLGHEIAHAWWWRGDPNTEDRWLFESMAEYSAMRFIESELGMEKRNVLVERKHKPAETAGPVLGRGRGNTAAVYQKGPLLLIGLEEKIGRPAMDKFLRALADNPPRNTAAWLTTLQASAGPQVREEFEKALRAETM